MRETLPGGRSFNTIDQVPAGPGDNVAQFTVAPGHVFVMGDNRDDSADSRLWGVVPRELVVGRAMFVIWSYDESAPSTGYFLLDFLKNTRWSRMGRLIR